MRRWIIVGVLSIGLATIVGLSAFAIGGRVGFMRGYHVATYASDVTTASILVAVRKAEERGDSHASDLLESLIDQAFITDWANRHLVDGRPFYAPSDAYLDTSRAMTQIAQYRRAHARKPIEGPGEAMIQDTLARYASAPSQSAAQQGAAADRQGQRSDPPR